MNNNMKPNKTQAHEESGSLCESTQDMDHASYDSSELDPMETREQEEIFSPARQSFLQEYREEPQEVHLLNLQDIDLEALRLKKRLQEEPLRKELLELKEKLKQAQSTYLLIIAKRKDKEMELAESKESYTSYQEQMKACAKQQKEAESDARLLQSLQLEMSMLAKRIEKIEFTLPGVEGEYEKILMLEEKALATRDRLKGLIAQRETQIRQAAGKAYYKVEELAEERSIEASRLDEDLLERYETLRQKKGGIAVARLQKSRCSACGHHFQDAVLSRYKKGPSLSECPNCHRMLVVRIDDELDSGFVSSVGHAEEW